MPINGFFFNFWRITSLSFKNFKVNLSSLFHSILEFLGSESTDCKILPPISYHDYYCDYPFGAKKYRVFVCFYFFHPATILLLIAHILPLERSLPLILSWWQTSWANSHFHRGQQWAFQMRNQPGVYAKWNSYFPPDKL